MTSDFFQQIYEVVRHIPHGKATSYGAIAKYLGKPNGARIVGWAMNASHHLENKIPAHRVVNRNGMLTGAVHFLLPNEMQNLLEKEGFTIVNGSIKNFDAHFWEPQIDI